MYFLATIIWIRIFLFQLPVGYQYEQFQWELPNGFRVPNPCNTHGVWSGVGHLGPKGSGPRNEFGVDFQRAKFTWTKDFCIKDSDGDGVYNGAELGDPLCVWTKNSQVRLLPATSHPGVCEPWDSPRCKARNGSVVCSSDMQCAAAYEPGIQELKVNLPLTRVPMEEDSYTCMTFNLPTDRDYHMTEAKPSLYNRRVVHDMVLYACDEKHIVPTGQSYPCQHIASAPCDTIIAIYSSETPITCLHKDVGILVGRNGIRQVMLQVHMLNPQRLEYEDKSGMTLFLSPKLRAYNAGFALIDSTVFEIPPGHTSYPVIAGCPGDCTLKRVKSPVYVIFGTNHMHGIGRKQRIELIRNKKIVAYLTENNNYKWKNPRFDRSASAEPQNFTPVLNHAKPVQMFPGDSLRLICEYDSSKLNRTVTRGHSTENEMCQSQLMYYPAEGWQQPICRGYKHVPLCKFETIGSAFGCHYRSFVSSVLNDTLISRTINRCSSTVGCSDECLKLVAKERKHACLQGELYDLWKSNVVVNPDPKLLRLYTAMTPCEASYEKNAHLISNSHSRGSIQRFNSQNIISTTPSKPTEVDKTAAFIPPNLKTIFKSIIDGNSKNTKPDNERPLLSPMADTPMEPEPQNNDRILELQQRLKPVAQVPVGQFRHSLRTNILRNQQLLPNVQRFSRTMSRPVNIPFNSVVRNQPFAFIVQRPIDLHNILLQIWRRRRFGF